MDSTHYYSDIPPGGVSRRGATPSAAYSTTPWFTRAAAPFDGAAADEWTPPDDLQSQDVHDFPAFDVSDGPPAVGPSAENVIGGGDFPIGASFDNYTSSDFGETADNIVLGDE